MGLFDGRSYSTSELLNAGDSHSKHRSSSQTRERGRNTSPSARSSRTGGYYTRPAASSANSNFFSNFGGASQSRGIFSSNSSSSYYKRRPRDGYIQYLLHKAQRMIKELWYYARKHPVKAFFAVVVPLLSAGGAVHGLLKQFGVKLPFGMDGGGARRGGGGYYDSRGYGGGGGFGGAGGGGNWMDQAGGLMQIAKAFM